MELYTIFLQPLVGPGLALGLLVAGGWRQRSAAGLALALGLLLPAFVAAQGLLNFAYWCSQPLTTAGPTPPVLPWYCELLLVPVCYLYFRVLSRTRAAGPLAWRHLLPGLGQLGLFAGVAILGLGAQRGALAAHFGSPGAAARLLGHVVGPLSLVCYVLLFLYGLRALDDHRRYHASWPAEGDWQGFEHQRSLLILLLLGFGLGLGFVALNAWFGPLAYSASWYGFAVRGGLIFGLAVVGLQATYARVVGPARRYGLPAGWAVATPPPAASGALRMSTPAPVLVSDEPLGPAPEPAPDLLLWRDRLLQLMDQAQPWREPDLTLPELAQWLQLHPAFLSKVINAGCGQNFNDFVNTYRTQEAQHKLADPRFAHYSVLGVALESGFNSKSTFNRVFKKLTGQAPSDISRPKL
ncbi:AraC family transcriptional regulator [Hymenobacter sp. BT559]|uniref:helix-turn-helix domain-containing protein n=1 Tax=Hymenobacter sp. BT559 TaxID=2795729 RepID=UPI0018EA901F|nr:helix-turn-helix transcriptional regulator [Hymenobacter sp. BT559]MBJ6145161.1 helix-turn-helix transcriptional regulator [Hymenobacter sp. BT559]